MKILYAIQGTGNGHLARAKEIIPALQNRAQVDVLISGIQSEISIPFDVKYRFKGISFIFGEKGGINYGKTILKNNIFRFFKEIFKCKVDQYDLIINDFEPISAWACFFKGTNCISLSHQSALISTLVPKPKKKSRISRFIIRKYAPSIERYGFHFKSYDRHIFTPVIRKEIRKQKIKDGNYYIVYLPAYSDERIIKVLSKIKKVKWKVFSKTCEKPYQRKNVFVKPIQNKTFARSMASAKGIICGAGFETPAEALYLHKKLMVIPMKGQYEQQCNATSLAELGVAVIEKFNKKNISKIEKWIKTDAIVEVNFPDQSQYVIDKILTNHIMTTELSNQVLDNLG